MKFRIRFADQLVGAFLLAAVLAVAVILVFVGINQRWFAKNYQFRSRFDSAGGLSVGMPIDLLCYARDSLKVTMKRRFEDGDVYFGALTQQWLEGTRKVFHELPPLEW